MYCQMAILGRAKFNCGMGRANGWQNMVFAITVGPIGIVQKQRGWLETIVNYHALIVVSILGKIINPNNVIIRTIGI